MDADGIELPGDDSVRVDRLRQSIGEGCVGADGEKTFYTLAENFTGLLRSNAMDHQKSGATAAGGWRRGVHLMLDYLSAACCRVSARLALVVKVLVTLALVVAGLAAQETSVPATIVPRPGLPGAKSDGTTPQPSANIRVDTNLVLIPVAVADPLNRPITGLERETFQITEDKVKQTIISFGGEDAPLSVGIVFDTSGSMSSTIHQARQAVTELFKVANPEDEAFLIEFSDRPELVTPFTRNLDEIRTRLTFTRPKGRTALLDGALLALRTMKKAHNPRKALIVISDGADNSSRYTESELRNVVKEADVQIYSVAISGPGESGVPLLQGISEPTGGRCFVVGNVNDLPDVAEKIGVELRNQYVLGYSPTNSARDGKYRRVTVKIIQPRGLPPLRATWRTGYYAPTQ